MREDPNVIQNYGKVLVGLAQSIPDGIVAFFVSYSYMENIISKWHDTGILREIMQHKLIFMETQDVVETTLALDNYRRACNEEESRGIKTFFLLIHRYINSLKEHSWGESHEMANSGIPEFRKISLCEKKIWGLVAKKFFE